MALAFSSWRSGLDVRMRRVGQDITLTRQLASGSQSVVCRAVVRTNMPQEFRWCAQTNWTVLLQNPSAPTVFEDVRSETVEQTSRRWSVPRVGDGAS